MGCFVVCEMSMFNLLSHLWFKKMLINFGMDMHSLKSKLITITEHNVKPETEFELLFV